MTRKLFTLAISLLLAACNLPGQQQKSSSSEAWFDMPVPNTVIRPPNPCQVIAHGASPAGVAAFELSVNDKVVANAPSPDSKKTLATFNHDCGPLQPGKNIIEIRSRDSAGSWSERTQTIVFVLDESPSREITPPVSTVTPGSTLTDVPTLTATLTLTPTSVPTETPTPVPTGGVAVESISTNLVYLGRSGCGPTDVTIAARATAPKGITVVVLFYRFETGNSSSGFESVGMKSIDGDLYRVTLNPTSLLGGSVPFDQATLQYQIVVQQKDGDTTIRTPVLADIAVEACGGVTVSCPSYTDKRSCQAHGCNWVSIPGIVPIYACEAP